MVRTIRCNTFPVPSDKRRDLFFMLSVDVTSLFLQKVFLPNLVFDISMERFGLHVWTVTSPYCEVLYCQTKIFLISPLCVYREHMGSTCVLQLPSHCATSCARGLVRSVTAHLWRPALLLATLCYALCGSSLVCQLLTVQDLRDDSTQKNHQRQSSVSTSAEWTS